MKVYCVMEKDVYDWSCNTPDALCSIWFSKEKAETVAAELDVEFEPYEHFIRIEEVK